jgi:hypothetical protein
MLKLLPTFCLLVGLGCASSLHAQIKILSGFINPASVYPESLTQMNVLNQSSADEEVYLEASIVASSNENIIHVKTNPFFLKPGMNSVSGLRPVLSAVTYNNNESGKFLSTYHYLPGGSYRYCARLYGINNLETMDEFCDDIEAYEDNFLNLVLPADGDTVLTTNPFLIWSHSQPFSSINKQGEYYRMTVTEIKDNQTPQEAMVLGNPDWMREYLISHYIQYPFDAKKLEKGKWYTWQVQQISNFIVINTTDVWKFFVKDDKPVDGNKYAIMKRESDGGYYVAAGNMLYFSFEERYGSDQKLQCKIRSDSQKNPIAADARSSKKSLQVPEVNVKKAGDNRYEINLNGLPINSGFHFLEVTNSKNEKFQLKFLVTD